MVNKNNQSHMIREMMEKIKNVSTNINENSNNLNINRFNKLLQHNTITENKLYGSNIVQQTLKRLGVGDNSNDTLNKLAIYGLFRNQPPYNSFGDISKLKSLDELNNLHNKWFETTITNLIRTEPFLDNKELARDYLNAYVNNIRTLGNNAKPFSMKNVEKELVDVVLNNRWAETKKKAVDKSNIYKPDSGDILFENDDVVVLKTDTKAKCVRYGSGESWCITKPQLNYYNTYRINYGATIYFVLQKNVEGDEHKLVILNYGRDGYSIADRSNSGSRTGSQHNATSWSFIERMIPNLSGLEEYFKYVPVTDSEKDYVAILKQKIVGDDMMFEIENITKNLIVNGSEVEPQDFIRDYIAQGHRLTYEQIQSLDETVIDSIIESGYEFDSSEYKILSDTQKRRYSKLALENDYDISYEVLINTDTDTQIEYLEDRTIDDLIDASTTNYNTILEYIINLFGLELPEKYSGDDKYSNLIDDYYTSSPRSSMSANFAKQILDDGYYDYHNDYFRIKDISNNVNNELFNIIKQEAIEDNLIPDDVNVDDLTDFDDIIEYIEGTDIEDKLRDADNRATETVLYGEAYDAIIDGVDTFLSDYNNLIIVDQAGFIDDTTGIDRDFDIVIEQPYYGFDGSYSSSDLLEAYLDL